MSPATPRRAAPCPRRHARPAFSLVEALVALVIIGIAVMVSLRTAERHAVEVVDDAAAELQRAVQGAVTEAAAQPGWMRLYVQPGGGRDSLGRAIALRVDAGADTTAGTSADSVRWVSFTDGATFGTGVVTGAPGPMGDPATAAVPTTIVRCDPATRCVFGTDSLAGWTTFYIQHADDPAFVRALVVGARGTVRVFKWRNNRWE